MASAAARKPDARGRHERARKLRAGQKYVSGKYAANGCMRLARAVWNFAKDELETPGLPERNPFRSGKLFHKERARKTGMSPEELPAWWRQVQALDNPIRREMHLFTLLSGPRKTDILTAQWGHVNWDKRSLRLPNPKGGDERAFELPLPDRNLHEIVPNKILSLSKKRSRDLLSDRYRRFVCE